MRARDSCLVSENVARNVASVFIADEFSFALQNASIPQSAPRIPQLKSVYYGIRHLPMENSQDFVGMDFMKEREIGSPERESAREGTTEISGGL